MIQVLPIVIGANAELSFDRGWTTVFEPNVMSLVPVREACSATTREEDREVGGLGAGGSMEARLLDILLLSIACEFVLNAANSYLTVVNTVVSLQTWRYSKSKCQDGLVTGHKSIWYSSEHHLGTVWKTVFVYL